MSVTLNRFANGDTNYVGKHNQNAETLEQTLGELYARTAAWQDGTPPRTFTALSDTPNAYTGYAGKLVRVKLDATGLEFTEAAAPSSFTGLEQTPDTLEALKFLRGNAAGTALEQVDIGPEMLSWMPPLIGNTGKLLAVKADETGLEAAAAFSPSAFKGLSDVAVATFAGAAGVPVIVNAAGERLVLDDRPVPKSLTQLQDCPSDLAGQAGKALVVRTTEDGFELRAAAGGGVTRFDALSDGPGAYTGQQYKVPMVNPGETGLMWATFPAPSLFLGLQDVWAEAASATRLESYAGQAGKSFRVAWDEAGIELTDGAVLTQSEADARYDPLGQAAAALTAHAAANDPHPGYQPVSEKGAANGYASLDANGRVPTAQIPAQPYVIAAFYPGAPPASALITLHVVTEAVTLASDFAGSYGRARTAASAQADCDVRRNGSTIGTIRFAAGADAPTFLAGAAVSLSPGDYLEIVAPATPDATLADIALSLKGTR